MTLSMTFLICDPCALLITMAAGTSQGVSAFSLAIMRLSRPMSQILKFLDANEDKAFSPSQIGYALPDMTRSPKTWAQPWCRRLEDMWLVGRNRHGHYYITMEGKALVRAGDWQTLHATPIQKSRAVSYVRNRLRHVTEPSSSATLDVRNFAFSLATGLAAHGEPGHATEYPD